VISELRKGTRCDPNVRAWFSPIPEEEIFLSVLTIGEIRKGIESIRLRDQAAARVLDRWLRQMILSYKDRILPVDQEVAERWGEMNVPDPLPVLDGLIAATARVHDLTVATRNAKDMARTGVPFVNPFVRR
jgi:Predicted nucleic acid-binding protein, contains PIN domain